MVTTSRELGGFLAQYDPAIAALARAAIARLRRRLPGARMLVYDNYNALVVGFGPSDRTSDAVLSIALYPRWVTPFLPERRLSPRSSEASAGQRTPGQERQAD